MKTPLDVYIETGGNGFARMAITHRRGMAVWGIRLGVYEKGKRQCTNERCVYTISCCYENGSGSAAHLARRTLRLGHSSRRFAQTLLHCKFAVKPKVIFIHMVHTCHHSFQLIQIPAHSLKAKSLKCLIMPEDTLPHSVQAKAATAPKPNQHQLPVSMVTRPAAL